MIKSCKMGGNGSGLVDCKFKIMEIIIIKNLNKKSRALRSVKFPCHLTIMSH